jgi:hypothetical protein
MKISCLENLPRGEFKLFYLIVKCLLDSVCSSSESNRGTRQNGTQSICRSPGKPGMQKTAHHPPQLGGFHGAAIPNAGFPGAAIPPPMQPLQQQRNVNYSNIYKRYNYWNVCFLCSFDIEEGHNLQKCPFQKANHQRGFTCKNAQQDIAVGYNPSTKGMHKSVLPMAPYN